MTYNGTKTAAGQVMPLLMGCSIPSPIEVGEIERKVIYDSVTQKVILDMKAVGTKYV